MISNVNTSTIYAPVTLMQELRVEGSLATDNLTPPTNKKIEICGLVAGIFTVTNALTATKRSTICFGTGHDTDQSKIIWSGRCDAKCASLGVVIMPIHLIGDVNEIVRLTNMTYSVGDIIVRCIIYYNFI